jgi:hypothetical protein
MAGDPAQISDCEGETVSVDENEGHQPNSVPKAPPVPESSPQRQSKAESLKLIAGLAAVAIGALIVGVIATVAVLQGGTTAAQIASSSGGVIATMVGAYFGVKVGSDQTKAAMDGQRAEAAKAQAFAAHVPSEKAEEAIDRAELAARNIVLG